MDEQGNPPLFLLDSKAAGLLDGAGELLPELVEGFVGRDVDAVEASVGLGKIARINIHKMKCEKSGSSSSSGAL